MNTKALKNASRHYEQSHQTWLVAAERLDYLRTSKALTSSSFVQRQYEHALWDFNIACSARKRAKVEIHQHSSNHF